MELFHERFTSDAQSTLSLLFIGEAHDPRPKFECFFCEDEKRAVKVRGETRFPPGRREIKFRTEGGMHHEYLERFGADFHKGMLWIQDIENFEYVYLHIGNNETQSEGCPLTGMAARSNLTGGGTVEESVTAYKRMYAKVRDALLRGERVFITTIDRDR